MGNEISSLAIYALSWAEAQYLSCCRVFL